MVIKFCVVMKMIVRVHSLKNKNSPGHIWASSIKSAGRYCFGRKYLTNCWKSDFSLYAKEFNERSQADASVECYWKALKRALLEATYKTGRWTKVTVGHWQKWWWNDNANNSVS